jgi:hypothetical protein
VPLAARFRASDGREVALGDVLEGGKPALLGRCHAARSQPLLFGAMTQLNLALAATGAEPIGRQTQLAVLLLLEHTLATGAPTASMPSNDTAALRRIA